MAYLSFAPAYSSVGTVDVSSISSWERIVHVYDALNVGELRPTQSAAEDFVAVGQASLRAKGFLDGTERQMDMFRYVHRESWPDFQFEVRSDSPPSPLHALGHWGYPRRHSLGRVLHPPLLKHARLSCCSSQVSGGDLVR